MGKFLGRKILWWCELIVSIRVLLFCAPVLMKRNLEGAFSLSAANDRFIVLLSCTAMVYFVLGFFLVMGYKRAAAAHYAAVVFIFFATIGLTEFSAEGAASVDKFFIGPLMVSVVLVLVNKILCRSQKAA